MRETNEDALAVAQQDDMVCFVMADGAGGHEAGEVAAGIVVDAVLQRFLKESCFGLRALRSYVEAAAYGVAQGKKAAPRRDDMSTTLATLLIDQSNHQALWAHLGDTRIYLFRGGKLLQVTKDHSVAQQFIDAGFARVEQLRGHPRRNTLYGAIGAEPGMPAEATEQAVPLRGGDVFLICTDGFWEWVHEDDMERTLAEAVSSNEWLSAMNKLADAKVAAAEKTRDNYSVFAIWVREPTPRAGTK